MATVDANTSLRSLKDHLNFAEEFIFSNKTTQNLAELSKIYFDRLGLGLSENGMTLRAFSFRFLRIHWLPD